MEQLSVDKLFGEITEPMATEREKATIAAFHVEAQPIPEGLEWDGIPTGHIAYQGDFDLSSEEISAN